MSDIDPRPYSKDYEITDAMFGAFRSEGGTKFFFKLTGWATFLYTILYVVTVPQVAASYGRLIGLSVRADSAEAVDAAILTTFFGMTPFIFLMFVGAVFIAALMRAAFFRGYFFGDFGGAFPFRLRRDEVNQILSMLGYYALFVVVYIVLLVAVVLVAGGLTALAGDNLIFVSVLLSILMFFGVFAASIWYGITFAPSGALTAFRGRVHILAARKITKNRFWALFGSLFVAGLIAYVLYYVVSIIGLMMGVAGLFDSEFINALASEDSQAALDGFSARTRSLSFRIGALFAIIMSSFGGAFYTLMISGPSAFFVRQWDEADPSRAFE